MNIPTLFLSGTAYLTLEILKDALRTLQAHPFTAGVVASDDRPSFARLGIFYNFSRAAFLNYVKLVHLRILNLSLKHFEINMRAFKKKMPVDVFYLYRKHPIPPRPTDHNFVLKTCPSTFLNFYINLINFVAL